MNNHVKFMRANNVITFDKLIRERIDDEELFEEWLTYGVADGDIDEETTWEDVDDYYISDENYEELRSLFKRLLFLQECEEV